jgi:hypothetical protein
VKDGELSTGLSEDERCGEEEEDAKHLKCDSK